MGKRTRCEVCDSWHRTAEHCCQCECDCGEGQAEADRFRAVLSEVIAGIYAASSGLGDPLVGHTLRILKRHNAERLGRHEEDTDG
jgi:hypothetical protein